MDCNRRVQRINIRGYFIPNVAHKAQGTAFPVIPQKNEAQIVCSATEDVRLGMCISINAQMCSLM